MALWIIAYGAVQASAPKLLKARDKTDAEIVRLAVLWVGTLALIPAALALASAAASWPVSRAPTQPQGRSKIGLCHSQSTSKTCVGQTRALLIVTVVRRPAPQFGVEPSQPINMSSGNHSPLEGELSPLESSAV